MKQFTVITFLLITFSCSGQQTATDSVKFLEQFHLSGFISGNFNKHYDIAISEEEWRINWGSFHLGMGFTNKLINLHAVYGKPITPLYPPKKVFHQWRVGASINLVSIFNNFKRSRLFIGPLFFCGQTSGFQNIDKTGELHFDDEYLGGGVFSKLKLKNGFSLTMSLTQYRFDDERAPNLNPPFTELHIINSLSVGFDLVPSLLLSSKRMLK